MANVVKPNYVMKKSAWSVIRPWHILLSFLIVPLIIMIIKIINIKDDKEFLRSKNPIGQASA